MVFLFRGAKISHFFEIEKKFVEKIGSIPINLRNLVFVGGKRMLRCSLVTL